MKIYRVALTTFGAIMPWTFAQASVNISIDGVTSSLSEAVEYDQNQNHGDGEATVDGSSVTMTGNLWRAFAFPGEGLDVTSKTMLRFDFDLEEEVEFQAICVDEDLELSNEKRCVVIANNQGWIQDMYNAPHMASLQDKSVHFDIPIGKFFTGNMKYLAMIQDNDSDTSAGLSTISNIVIDHESTGDLKFSVNGEITQVENTPVQYGSGQDTASNLMIVSEDGASIEVQGNSYKALTLTTPVEIKSNTVFEFDFNRVEGGEIETICFEENLNTDDAKRCFYLGGSQGWSKSFNHLEQIDEGETKHYEIPIGNFYTGSFQYLAFMIDMDADRSKGHNIYSNLELYDADVPDLKIMAYGDEVLISDTFGSYHTNQDSPEHPLVISQDGLEVSMTGNMWKSVTLPSPIEITPASQLDFDFYLGEKTEIHAICFDENLVPDTKSCLVTANTQSWSDQVNLSPKTNVGETRHYSVPIGTYFTGSMQYVAFAQDNDSSNRDYGISTYSNIVISERPGLNLGVVQGGVRQGLPLLNHQLSYGSGQDTSLHLIDVSDDGTSATLRGNLWKAFEIPDGLTIGDSTILTFDFIVEEMAEIHSLCIDEDLNYSSDFPRCLPFAGTQDVSNDGSHLYRGVEQVYSTNEAKKYVIRLSEFFYGEDFKYLAFIHDNDSSDRTTGISTFSNIEIYEDESCMKDESFEFSFDECTTENFVAKFQDKMDTTAGCIGNNVWVELLTFFDVDSKPQIEKKIGDVCSSGYKGQYLPFEVITGKHFQFSDEFFDGGNSWNYENEANVDVNKIEVVHNEISDANRPISMPDVHNFKNCELRAAMCCYVANRKSEEADADPVDNSDACYMDFSRAQESNHVRDGYSIYGNGVEGNLNCHGFAWGADEGHVDNALKGNSLFQVAMYDSLYTNGLSEELPGAPMCGCVEQMPVVTKASCSKIEVEQTVSVKYDGSLTEFIVNVDIQSIDHVECTNNDLSSHYDELVQDGKASEREKSYLDNYLVGDGNCPDAVSKFLEEKGFTFA